MSKKLLVLLALVMLIVPLASTQAQTLNEGIDYCQIMQSDDCQLLVDSATAMSAVESFAFDMALDYDIAIEGDDMQGMGDINFGISGNGMLAIDTESVSTIQNLAMTDPQAYMAQLPTLMDQLFAGIEGEAYIVVTLPDMLAPMVGTSELPINVLAKDGQFVIDVRSLEEALGEDPSGMEWAGIDLNGAFGSMLGDMDLSSFYTDEQLDAMTFDSAVLQDAMTITRLADSEVNGNPVAVFESTLDYSAMLNAMGMRETLQSMYLDMGMDQEEIDAALSMFDNIEVVFRQYVGLVDSYTYRFEMNMDFAFDGETFGEPSMESMALGFDMSFEMSDFNSPVDIELPENAMIMPFEMLMGGGA